MNAVIFDLDDTLIDTAGVLVPEALRRVASAVGCTPELLDRRGKRIEEVLAPLGAVAPDRRAAAAREWYAPHVPPLAPLPGARELLEALRGRVRLLLVTRGVEERQRNKVRACELGEFFDAVAVTPIEGGRTKRDDFARLLEGHDASRCAVVGDDPRDELAHGAALGCVVVRVPETPLPQVEARLVAAGVVPAAAANGNRGERVS